MSKSFSRVLAVTTATLLMLLGQGTVAMANNEQSFQGEEIVANQLIVQLEKDAPAVEEIFDFGAVLNYSPIGLAGAGTYLVKVNPFDSLATNLSRIEAIDGVEFAEPNYEVELQNANDTRYVSGEMWGMYGSTSSSTASPTSSNGANAAGAWAKGYTGSRAVYVAVIDSGINISHSDLAANIWTNAQEVAGDGIDNDNNGFVDDINGFDFLNNDGSVYDAGEHPHGTHVAGTIGAVGGNGTGVTGVAWQVSVISAKIVNANGQASIADAIEAIDYITMLRMKKGLDIIASNNSWGGTAYSRSLENAIKRGGDVGIIFVAAAGNEATNLDTTAQYPAAYDCTTPHRPFDCVVSVAAIDQAGNLASYSNFSATKVDLAAPGTNILSTSGDGYDTLSGTSMATPHVTGAIALCLAAYRGTTAEQAIAKVKSTATSMGSLAGKVATGGRLNVSALVDSCAAESTALAGAISNAKLSALYTDRARVDWDDTVAGDFEQELQISVGPNGCAGPFAHFGYIGPGLTALPVFNLQEAQFYCFQVRGIRDAATTSWNKSNVAITWTSNLPYITGRVTMADGVTPVAKMQVRWIASGANPGSDNQNALLAYTNLAGEYVLQVPNGTEGELFINTPRWANRGLETIPHTPWGMEAGGKLTVTQDTVVDIRVPSIKTVTVTVLDYGTNQPIVGGKVQFDGNTKSCINGSYTAFTGATQSRCVTWPAGYAHSGPVTDAQGKVKLALFDTQHVSNPTFDFMVLDPRNEAKSTLFTLTTTSSSEVTVVMNPPVVFSGKVLMADGTTPVSGAVVNWLNDGQYAGLENSNSIKTLTNSSGEYSISVPSGTLGRLFVTTTRSPRNAAPTSPQLPWGLDAGGMTSSTTSREINLVMPNQHMVTFNITNASTGASLSGAILQSTALTKTCRAGTYTPFAGATSPSCTTWPAGYSHSAPRANSQGVVRIAVFAQQHLATSAFRHDFNVIDPADSSRTTNVSVTPNGDVTQNVAMNLPVTVTGKVFMADGTTPVAGAPVKWLNDGQNAGAENENAVTSITNSSGEYTLQVPNGSPGRLFVNTSRRPNSATPTTPLIPWGMEAGGNTTFTQSRTVNIVLPAQQVVKFQVKEWASNEAVANATAEFSGFTKTCRSGSYTPFAGATGGFCTTWPGGYSHAAPKTNSGGEVSVALFASSLLADNNYTWIVSHPLDSARVTRVNFVASQSATIPVVMPGTPSKPEQPTATALTNEVRLNWTEPWNGGAFIDYYKVWVSLEAGGPFSLVTSGSCAGNVAPDLRTCVVTNLTPGVTYYFAIIAHNVIGYSQLSVAVSSTPRAAISTFTSSPTPTVSGIAQVGQFLIAEPGPWDSGAEFDYEWQRDGSAISGAVGSSYLLRAADAGKAITVKVTGRKTGFQSVTKLSGATTPAWPTGSRLVVITGSPVIGQLLIAQRSPLVNANDVGFQWLREGQPIAGATGEMYEATSADVGQAISVQLTGAVLTAAPTEAKIDTVMIVSLASEVVTTSRPGLLVAATESPIAIPTVTPPVPTQSATASYEQSYIPAFIGKAFTLTAAQKAAIKEILKGSTANKFVCTAIRLTGGPASQNVLFLKRAKAVCDYAKIQRSTLSTWFQSKPTKAKSFAGRVLIGLRG
jgi:subtilisin family serine protease